LQPTDLVIAAFKFVLLIFSLSVHECAHAWTASRLGDQTARLQGRVTLNPVYHVDPIGTLLIPGLMIFGPLISNGAIGGFLIGWAKPTPVITRNLRNIRRDEMLVTLAGPASNLLIAFVAFFVLALLIVVFHGHLPQQQDLVSSIDALAQICFLAIQVNVALFFFNLLPIPPLDGSHILRNFLPYNFLNVYDRMGMFGFMLMIFVGGPIVRLLMIPTMGMVDFGLGLVQRI
jgi:Zn-dependent protease